MEAKTYISENYNSSLSSDQVSAVRKALFINWILNFAKAHPERFPEKEGRVIHQTMGDFGTVVPLLSRHEILSWYSRNRPETPMTAEEFDVIMAIQKTNGLIIVGDCYYTITA